MSEQLTKEKEKVEVPKHIKELHRVLLDRAISIGYRDRIPRYPDRPNESTLMGYQSRMHNWLQKLYHVERCHEMNNNSYIQKQENVVYSSKGGRLIIKSRK